MSDTPRCNAHSLDMETEDFDVELAKTYELAWQLERELNNLYGLLRVANETSSTSDSKVIRLERELNAAKAALSGRTVSCSNCNAMAEENAELREKVNSLEFRLAQEKHLNDDHDRDYLAVWKLIKRPDETVVQAVQRVKAENEAMRDAINTACDMCDGLDLHLPGNHGLFLLKALDKLQPYLK